MRRLKQTLWVALLSAATLILSHGVSVADSKPAAMNVGIVNVQRILAETPEYQQKSQEYLDERKKLFDPGKAKTPKQFQQELLQRKGEIQAAEERWNKIKQDFITQTTDKIRRASEQVLKDKNLSFVLMDAPWYPGSPLRQYGAVDVTTDVLLAMKNLK